jgi:hypothetical protein
MALAERVRVFDFCSTNFIEVIEDEHSRAVPPGEYKEVMEKCT